MHCKQADSAILKLLLVQASMGPIYFITKQTYVVITRFCRDMGYVVAFTRVLSQIAFCCDYAICWVCFVQTFTYIDNFTQILCRYLSQKLETNSSVPHISALLL